MNARQTRLVAVAGAVAVVTAVGFGAFLLGKRSTADTAPQSVEGGSPVPAAASAADQAGRTPAPFVAMEASSAPEPYLWLDVRDPAATHAVLEKNAWVSKALKEPLGQGFFEAWAAFYGTRGEEVGGKFKGTVMNMVLKQVLDKPYRVVWFGGSGAQGAPALVMKTPSGSASAAFDTLVEVAGNGGFNAARCTQPGEDADAGSPASEVRIHRVTLAEKTLYVAKTSDRALWSTAPQAVQAALCLSLDEVTPREGVAMSLTVSLAQGSRGTQSVADLLGLSQTVGFDFATANDSFVPKGLDAKVVRPNTLAIASPDEAMLKAIPSSAGVVLFLSVKLPATLTGQTLHDMLDEEAAKGPTVERQVALVWSPSTSKNELEVVWGRKEDEAALNAALKGGNGALKRRIGCSDVIVFATDAFGTAVDETCRGKSPSLLAAAGPVVQGIKKPSSLMLTVALGTILSKLTHESFTADSPAAAGAGSNEIEAARRLLEELPSLGFTGTAPAAGSNGALVTSGFKS